MNESRVWWEECGAGLDMQTGYEGEQGVVGRVEQSWICRQGMKESRVCWEECGAGLDMQRAGGEQGVVGRVWSRAGYADTVFRRAGCCGKSVEQGWICRQSV